jgi:hypothetical protein
LAEALIPGTFAVGGSTNEGFSNAGFSNQGAEPAQLPAKLEQTLGLGRNSWPVSAIRKLADEMIKCSEGRKRGAAHELRWLNLCGFCLRPGF